VPGVTKNERTTMDNANTPPTEAILPDIDARIERELTVIPRDKQGNLILTLEHNSNLAEETRLVLLLHAGTGSWRILPVEVFSALKEEFYRAIHPNRGGLNWEAYNKYARGSTRVAEAAAAHRAHIESAQPKP
jgi:hypothetical protein